jgi:cytochrome c
VNRTRHRFAAAVLFVLASAAGSAHAGAAALTNAEAKKLFNSRSCNACHAVDETRIGPAFRAVALRYHDASPATVDWLATKIVEGGAGAWGNVPMVSNPAISPDEARRVARWILSLGPGPAKP